MSRVIQELTRSTDEAKVVAKAELAEAGKSWVQRQSTWVLAGLYAVVAIVDSLIWIDIPATVDEILFLVIVGPMVYELKNRVFVWFRRRKQKQLPAPEEQVEEENA